MPRCRLRAWCARISLTPRTPCNSARHRPTRCRAALEQAEINLSYTEIRAPQSGRITMRNVELGTYVQVGQQIFYLVTPDTWVVANYKEKQLDGMKPGQPVDMRVDAFPALRLHGHVDSIQQGSGARFSAFPRSERYRKFREDRAPSAGQDHHR